MARLMARRLLRRLSSLIGRSKDDAVSDPRFGRGTYGRPTILDWGEGAKLKIGQFCSISAGVQIFLGGEHRPDWVTTYPFNVLRSRWAGIAGHPRTKGDVVIGSDVWLGRECVILSGVTIGDGAVVGARALVTRSVAPYEMVGGNPARRIGFRFDDETIERLLRVAWWDFDDQTIDRLVPLLLSSEVHSFLDAAENERRLQSADSAPHVSG